MKLILHGSACRRRLCRHTHLVGKMATDLLLCGSVTFVFTWFYRTAYWSENGKNDFFYRMPREANSSRVILNGASCDNFKRYESGYSARLYRREVLGV
ncbi:MAG: hypothetical protein IJ368_02135 [Oscillospiraceae bacterium]|nr:hypothetical protein [Oscillospiraceae bacterium]